MPDQQPPVDYDKLAQSVRGGVDYDALAEQAKSGASKPPEVDASIWDRLKSAAYQASPLPLFEKKNLPTTAGAVAGAATGGLMAIPVSGLTAMAVSGAQGNPPAENITTGLLNAGAELGGVVAAPAAQRLMQSALKPSQSPAALSAMIKGAPVPPVVQTMLDEGINVSRGGIAKLSQIIGSTNQAVKDTIGSLSGTIDPRNVARQTATTAKKVVTQGVADDEIKSFADAVQQFLNHPVYNGQLTPTEAQALKQGTYQSVDYGKLGTAANQARKAIGSGLKTEIEQLAGSQGRNDIQALNAREGKALEAMEEAAHRVYQTGNRDIQGLMLLAHAKAAYLGMMVDRSPVLKSMLARGLWANASKVSGMGPQMLRALVQGVASTPDTSTDTPTASAPGQ